jgi:hypothetical protein
LKISGFILKHLSLESLKNLKNFLRTQKHLEKLILGYAIFEDYYDDSDEELDDLDEEYYQVVLDLWNSETLVTVNSRFVEHLPNIPDDQLKNHRIKTLKMKENLPTNDIELMQRCFRLVPAITCLHLPYENLTVRGAVNLINNLNYLNELVIYIDKTIDLYEFDYLNIKNLEKFSLTTSDGTDPHRILSHYYLKKFIKNHPKIKEMEIRLTCYVDVNVAGLLAKNLKQLERLVIKTGFLTLYCSSEDLESLRKMYRRI